MVECQPKRHLTSSKIASCKQVISIGNKKLVFSALYLVLLCLEYDRAISLVEARIYRKRTFDAVALLYFYIGILSFATFAKMFATQSSSIGVHPKSWHFSNFLRAIYAKFMPYILGVQRLLKANLSVKLFTIERENCNQMYRSVFITKHPRKML